MNDPVHEKAFKIFERAYDLPHGERTDFVDRTCEGDAALRTEVVSLLEHDETPANLEAAVLEPARKLLSTRAGDDDAWRLSQAAAPERIGAYRVIRTIGEGGMGVVYEAEQDSPKRRVALKVIRARILTPQMLTRFKREAELLGRLQHPGVAHIYEASIDSTEGARPFFAMELIDGLPIDQYAKKHDLDARARLELIARACDAVHYAHEQGVLHRDLKPPNILVEADGQPKILDFGVSRATDADVNTVTLQTLAGQLIGTIPYMSPEQVSGDPEAIDERSDVYALGVITFELLAGRLPYDLKNRPIPEAVRIIQEQDPSRLSSINRHLRGDIDTIVSKALEKDKARRYQTAADLAADIRRFLDDQPLVARPASTIYQLRKFARRNRTLVGGVIATILALALGAGFAVNFALKARDREIAAQRASYKMSIAAASAALEAGDVPSALRYLDDAPQPLRGWEWDYFLSQTDPVIARHRLPAPPHIAAAQERFAPRRCAFLADGSAVAAWVRDDSVELVDLMSGTVRGRFDAAEALLPTLTADGSRLAAFVPQDNSVLVWDVMNGALLSQIALSPTSDQPLTLVFSADGSRLVIATPHAVAVYDPVDGHVVASFPVLDLRSVDLTRDGDRLVVYHGSTLFVADTATGRVLSHRPLTNVTIVRIDPSGQTIAAGTGSDRSVILMDSLSLTEQARLRHPQSGWVHSLAWSVDGTHLVSMTDCRVFIWDMSLNSKPRVLHVNDCNIEPKLSSDVVINADRMQVALATPSEAVLADFGEDSALVLSGHGSYVYFVQFSPSGGLIASHDFAGDFRFWDAETGRAVGTLEVPWYMYPGFGLGWTSGGLGVAPAFATWSALSGWEDAPATTLDLARKATGGLWLYGTAFRARQSPWIMIKDRDRVDVVDSDTGKTRWSLPVASPVGAVSPDGDWVAFCKAVYDMDSGTLRHTLGIDYALDVSPDGTRIAGGKNYGNVVLVDTATFDEIVELRGHAGYVHDVAFSPDGSRLASASGDGTIRVWDARPRRERLRRAREIEELRTRLNRRFDELLLDASDLESALSAFIAEDRPSVEELTAAKDVLLLRALKAQEPPALHDLPASGRGVVARYDAGSGEHPPAPPTAEGGGWYWAKMNEGISAGASFDETGAAYWRMSVESQGWTGGRYACSLTDAVAQAAVEYGWRIRARVRINGGGKPISFYAAAMIDEHHGQFTVSCTQGGRWRDAWSEDIGLIGDCSTFHDIEWSMQPSSGAAQLLIDGTEIADAPPMSMVTHDAEDKAGKMWIRGSYTNAVVFGIWHGEEEATSVDVQSFEFAILDSRGQADAGQ